MALTIDETVFAQGLARFINTGAIQRDLKNQLRHHARSANHADHAQAARLLRYYLARETDPGPIGASFGAACHQLDRSDLMLAGARDRTSHSTGRRPRQSEQDIGEPGIIALASYDPDGQTVTLVLDAATANTAIYAIAAHAQEREAHLREIQLQAQGLPEGSYGRRNRQAIAARETRVTTRLRSIEQACQTAIEHGTAARTPEPAERFRPPDRAAGQEIDLEAGS